MSLKLIEGFDHFNTTPLAALKSWTAVGNWTFPAGRVNGLCLHTVQPSLSATYTKFLPSTYSTVTVGFAFQMINALIASNITIFRARVSTTNTCNIILTPAGKILVTNSGGTTIATGTATITANAWNYIEFHLVINGASGSVATQVNGSADIATTTGNFGSSNIDNIQVVRDALVPSGDPQEWDDIYVTDTVSPNTGFLGDVHVETIRPSADGTYSQWTPNTGTDHYSLVNDNTGTFPDEDTTYVSTPTLNNIDSYTYPALSLLSGTVFGVQTNLWARKDDAATRKLQPLVRRSGADYLSGTDMVLATSYVDGTYIWEVDPSTSAAWTIGGVNAAEFGVKVTA